MFLQEAHGNDPQDLTIEATAIGAAVGATYSLGSGDSYRAWPEGWIEGSWSVRGRSVVVARQRFAGGKKRLVFD